MLRLVASPCFAQQIDPVGRWQTWGGGRPLGTGRCGLLRQALRTPVSPWIETVLVPGGMNVADRRIIELVAEGDLAITADIPLAADVVHKGAQALDPRGQLYTDANVGERLATRNLVDQMRGAGQIMGGPSNFTICNRQAFANQLDRWLAKVKLNALRFLQPLIADKLAV